MAKTMKAAVVREFGKPLTIDEVPVPEVGPGQIQIAIQASGVCHTDLHAADGKVRAIVETAKIDDINAVFDRMHKGQIEGRVVLDLNA